MDEVGIEQARVKLGELVDQARIGHRHTLITRHGFPAAVIVNAEWYDQAQARVADLSGYEVHHKDGDPRNLDLANLELRKKPE